MLVEFSTRYVDGIVVVDVKGSLRLRGEERGFLLPRYVSELIGQGNNKILLNLEGVTKHDNSGVGELIVCQTVVRKRGAELKLANLSKTMLARLTFARLNTVFQVYENEADAIKAFRQNEGWPVTSPQVSTLHEVNPERATKIDNPGIEEQETAIKALQDDRWPSLQISTPHGVNPEGATKHDNSSLGERATAIKKFQSDGWTPLQISTRYVDGIAVVDVKGSLRLRLTGRTLSLDRYVSDLVDQGNKRILINLQGVTGQDSTGVGALIAWARTVRARGAELKLANVSQSLVAYLTLIRLIKVFQTYENEAAAIEAFRG
jgi:anti-sigma B factor antagonist